jgi:hypothetical protein
MTRILATELLNTILLPILLFLDNIHRPIFIMSRRNMIFVLMHHRHKLSDLIYNFITRF